MVLFYHLMAAIDWVIYSVASSLFRIIMDIANAQLFRAERISEIADRIYIVIGVLMLFKLVISGIQYIINPDVFDDKEKGLGGILKKTALSLAMMVAAPVVFNFLIQIQTPIITTLPTIILGGEAPQSEEGREKELDERGFAISFKVLSSFVRLRSGHEPDVANAGVGEGKQIHDFQSFYDNITEHCPWTIFGNMDSCTYDYMIIISTLCGGFLVYVLLSMALDVAIRTIKFGIIQMLAPIPIASYVFSKDKLNKFVKTAASVYTDLFIRMAIIYFIIFAIQEIMRTDVLNFLGINGGGIADTGDWFRNTVVNITLIFGLLMFASKAPKFISELLGLPDIGSGDLADMFKPAWTRAGGAAGAMINPVRNAVSNWKKAMDNNADWGERKHRRRLNALRHAIGGFGKGALDAAQGVAAGDDWSKMTERHNKSVAQSAKHGAAAFMRRTSKATAKEDNAEAVGKMQQIKNFFRDKKVDLHKRIADKRQEAEDLYNNAITNTQNQINTLRDELMSDSLSSEERASKMTQLSELEKEYSGLQSLTGKNKWIANKQRELVAADLASENRAYVSEQKAENNKQIAELQKKYASATDDEKRDLQQQIIDLRNKNAELDKVDISDSAMDEYVKTGKLKTEKAAISRETIIRGKVDQFFGGEGFTGQGYIDTADLLKNNRANLYTGESMTKMRQNVDILVDAEGKVASWESRFSTAMEPGLDKDGNPTMVPKKFTYADLADLKKKVDNGKITPEELEKNGFTSGAMVQSAFEDMEKQAAEAYVMANMAAIDPTVAAHSTFVLKTDPKTGKPVAPNETITNGIARMKATLATANIPKEEKDELMKLLRERPGEFFKKASDIQERYRTKGSRISAYNSGKKDSGS